MNPTPLIATVAALAALVATADQPKVVSVHDGDTVIAAAAARQDYSIQRVEWRERPS